MNLVAPTGTLAGTPVLYCRHIGTSNDGMPIWQAPEPTLYQLKLLHSREFNWFADAHALYVHLMFLASRERRIKDGAQGLALEAARGVIGIASREFYRQCRETGIWCRALSPHDDTLANEVVREFTRNANVEAYAHRFIRALCVVTFADPMLTGNHPALATTSIDPRTLNEEQRTTLYEELDRSTIDPLHVFNRALDIIDVHKKPASRMKLVELERVLTAAVRLINAVFSRAS